MLREQLLVEPRLVIEPLGVAGRHELDQIVIPLVGLGQQHQVVRRLARVPALDVAAARRHVHLAPEDRLHTALPCVIVENDRRKHIPVLGHRHGRHLQPGSLIEQLVDAARAVEQRILGVEMKMNELGHWRFAFSEWLFLLLTGPSIILWRRGPTPGAN